MNKKMFAVALTAACMATGNAYATSTTVTLYGIVDIGLGYESVRGPGGFHQSRVSEIQGGQNGSRFGLRGAEDLGDGLSAVFTLENGFGPTDGKSLQSSRLFGRQSTLGLDSTHWGRIEFGRQTNIASKFLGRVDPFRMSYSGAGIGNTFSTINQLRLDNLVMYQTPNVGGAKFGIGYSFNADDTQTTDASRFATADNTRALTTGVSYGSGPAYVAAAYDQFNGSNARAGGQAPSKIQAYVLGGAYDFEVVKILAAVGQTRNGWFGGRALPTTPSSSFGNFGSVKFADGFRATSTMLGISAPLGARASVFASWQRAAPNNKSLTGDDHTLNGYGVGTEYSLSKRTGLYAYAAYVNNYAFHKDVTDTVVAAGIRHRF